MDEVEITAIGYTNRKYLNLNTLEIRIGDSLIGDSKNDAEPR